MTHPTPLPAVELDAIGYSKRILALVDDYTDRPNKDTRAAIRAQLLSDFDGLLTALTAAQARAEAVEWQPYDTAPKQGEFLVYLPKERVKTQAAQRSTNGITVIGNAFDFDTTKPSHWRPLPPPPATDSAIGGKGA